MAVINFGDGTGILRKVTGDRNDPFMSFNFHLELDGLVVGGFQEVSGLSIETEVERKREGGRNDSELVFPRYTKFPDLVLSRGMSYIDQLYGWFYDVTQGRYRRRSGTIYLLDEKGIPTTWWDFVDALPIKWDGPSLNAQSGVVATEKFTLVHQGLKRSETPRLLQSFRSVLGV